MILEINLGPFAPVVGYVGAILAVVYGIWALIWKKKVWETPQNILPPHNSRVVRNCTRSGNGIYLVKYKSSKSV